MEENNLPGINLEVFTSTELSKNSGEYLEESQRQGAIVTKHGKPSVVSFSYNLAVKLLSEYYSDKADILLPHNGSNSKLLEKEPLVSGKNNSIINFLEVYITNTDDYLVVVEDNFSKGQSITNILNEIMDSINEKFIPTTKEITVLAFDRRDNYLALGKLVKMQKIDNNFELAVLDQSELKELGFTVNRTLYDLKETKKYLDKRSL